MYKKLILGAVVSVVLASGWAIAEETTKVAPATPAPAAATPAPATDANVPADLSDKLKTVLGAKPESLKSTPVPGVFEASFGGEIIYASADGNYVFSGELIDAKNKTSLTEQTRSAGRKTLMAQIDPSKTIEFKAKGEEKHVLYAFTDVECPFCVKLHKEIPALNDKGVTVRYLAYPRAGVGSSAYKKMVNIWCADNKQEAMSKVKDGSEIPTKECTNPVADDFALGQKLGVNGTPALFTPDGLMIPGFRPADQLVQMLDGAAKAKTETKAN
ncbi:MAG: hypothetical protein RI964_1514 [Pseudomonadota bacterium]|jgi:thiol:disulfide interchange protein DsbC